MIRAGHYFNRAEWALLNARNEKLPFIVRSHLTAVAVHACQSLKESLDQCANDDTADAGLAAAIAGLPHTELIENVRNMDLHGWPLPICDPKVRMATLVTKPGKPINLSSSQGVAVVMQLDGLKPRIRREPNDLKHGTASIGGATVSFGCVDGKLMVYDFSTNKEYVLLEMLHSFVKHCHAIIKSRLPTFADDNAGISP